MSRFFEETGTAQMLWIQNVSPQARAMVATMLAGLVVEFVAEVMLFRSTVPKDRPTLRARFWTRYVVGVALTSLVGITVYVVVNVMAHSGWGALAWVLAFVPVAAVLGTTFALQGMNTVLDESSGMGCIDLTMSAYKKKQGNKVKKSNKQTV